MAYQLKHIELALAENFGVESEDMPAFRARLRHLRNLGVPSTKPTGSGNRINYERKHAVQLLLALEAELLGMDPTTAASYSLSALRNGISDIEEAARNNFTLYMSVIPNFSTDKKSGWVYRGRRISDADHRRAFVNIAISVKRLDVSLNRLTGVR